MSVPASRGSFETMTSSRAAFALLLGLCTIAFTATALGSIDEFGDVNWGTLDQEEILDALFPGMARVPATPLRETLEEEVRHNT